MLRQPPPFLFPQILTLMKTPHIIALGGASHGVGKTTLANAINALFTEHKYKVKQYSFAEPLRQSVDTILIPAYPDVDWAKAKTFKNARLFDGFSYRDILIYIANSFRHINNNIFVNIAQTVYDEAQKARCHIFLIDDLRFPQELDWVKSYPSTTIYLTIKNFIPHPYPAENMLPSTSFDLILERDTQTPTALAQHILSYLKEKELIHD